MDPALRYERLDPLALRFVLIQDHLRSGGTERQSLALAAELAKRGCHTHLVVFREGGALAPENEEKLPFQIHYLQQGILKTDWYAPGLRKLVESLNPDIVIPMGRMANCHAGILATNKQRPYKLLATVRTGRSLPHLYRKALRQADHVVANSREALQRLATQYRIHRPDTSSVIYNGCLRDFETAIPSFAPTTQNPEPRTQNPEPRTQNPNPVHLCSISMFRPHKKQIRLLRICSKLPETIDWTLTLAGDGPALADCQAEAERLGVSHRVSFPGLLKDPRSLYFSADIAIHASDYEGLPNFLVEAQMAGLPVIAYDVNGVSETFLHDTSGYLVPHKDADQFLERLIHLASDEALQLRMSEAAKDFARQRFTLFAQTEAYLKLASKLATPIVA